MKFRASSNSDGPREAPPIGTYKGSLVTICDIGTQDRGLYGPKRELVFVWQLFKGGKPLLTTTGHPQTISQFFTATFGEKSNLRTAVESLLAMTFKPGDEFDLSALIGRGCRLSVIEYKKQTGEMGVKVGGLVPLDDDDAEPKPTLPIVNFEISRTACDLPADLPEWLQEKVKDSPEWSGTPLPSKAPHPTNGNAPPAAAGGASFNELADGILARI